MFKNKKIGLITGLVVDIIPIALSALADKNISNIGLRRLVLFFYSVRFELVCILLLLLFIVLVLPIFKRLISRDKSYFNTSICVVLVLMALSSSLINVKRIIYDRKVYYRNNYNLAQIQYVPFSEANSLYFAGDFDRAAELYSLVVSLQKHGYYSIAASDKLKETLDIISFRDNVFSLFHYVDGNDVDFTDFRGLQFLKNTFPGHYEYYYDLATNKVVNTISRYGELYEAVESNDLAQIHDLIETNGWCWFEKSLCEMFLSENSSGHTGKIKEYIYSESISDATDRLCKKWNVGL